MSHFVVIVTGEDHDKQMEPYYEQGEPDDYFMERVEEPVDFETARHLLKSTWDRNKSDGVAAPAGLPAQDASDAEIARWFEPQCELIDGVWTSVYYSNPNAKWDGYQVGGRWRGFWRIKPNVHPDFYSFGDASWTNSSEPDEPNTADVAMKRDIDFSAMRHLSQMAAQDEFDKYEAAVAGLPPALTWSEMLTKQGESLDSESPDTNVLTQARALYHDQPRIKALSAAGLLGWASGEDEFLVGRDEYVRRAGNGSFTPYAVLHEGTWYQRGEMGWFGIGHDEREEVDWSEQVANLFDSLPDDTVLTVIDVHI